MTWLHKQGIYNMQSMLNFKLRLNQLAGVKPPGRESESGVYTCKVIKSNSLNDGNTIVPQGIICQIAVVYEYIYRLQEEVEAGLKVGLCQLLSFSSPVERF